MVHVVKKLHKSCNSHSEFKSCQWLVSRYALTTHLLSSAFDSSFIRPALGLEDIKTIKIHAANLFRIRLAPTVAVESESRQLRWSAQHTSNHMNAKGKKATRILPKEPQQLD